MKTQSILALVGTLAVVGSLVFFGPNNDAEKTGGLSSTEEAINLFPIDYDDLSDAIYISGFGSDYTIIERSEDGLRLQLGGPKFLRVGERGKFTLNITNITSTFRPKDPFDYRQEKAEFLTAGPIVLSNSKGDARVDVFLNARTYEDIMATQSFFVTCTDVGKATITFKSEGMSDKTVPASAYATIVEISLECIDKDDPRYKSGYDELTDNTLGFSADSLNWVTFEQDGIILRINQIEPIRLEVGKSVEIYSDFHAKGTTDNPDHELGDAKLEFTIGGNIKIDSPLSRESNNYYEASKNFSSNRGLPYKAILWGFRSGTLTCLSEGKAVYSSVLTGFLSKGGMISQTASGLVDCEEPQAKAELDDTPMFAVVFTIDGIPYAQGQFQYADPEESVSATVGCPFYHVHSNVTVHPFDQWLIRGNTDLGLQEATGASLVDPAPDKCGFGVDNTLGPKSVFIPTDHFLDTCKKFELNSVETSENFDTRRTSELQEFCTKLGN